MGQYLSSFFHQPEGLVDVGPLGMPDSEEPCKLIISLFNLERETVQGLNPRSRSGNGGLSGYTPPPIYLNIYVIIAAVYTNKRYRESLSVLSQAISFLQSMPSVILDNGNRYSIEIVTPSWQDLSNIWTGFGGHYYPSMLCKIRGLSFDAGEVKRTMSDIKAADADIK